MSEGALSPLLRRAKHRKEVKRYHQRQQNRTLRTQTQDHDSQLFIFRHDATEGEVEVGAPPSTAAVPGPQLRLAITGRCDCPGLGGSAPPSPAQSSLSPETSGGGVSDGSTNRGRCQHSSTAAAAAGNGACSPDRDVDVEEEGEEDGFDDWGFDFVFRSKQRHDSELFEGGDTAACSHENAIVPSSFYEEFGAEEVEENGGDSRSVSPPPHSNGNGGRDPAAYGGAESLVPVKRLPKKSFGAAPPSPSASSSASPKMVSAIPVASGSAPRGLSSIHVRRVEGVPPLPVVAPLPAGTDINIPTRNYLTVDTTFNIHQHAPGFTRNAKVAMRSLLTNAMMGWKGQKENTLVLSTGDAMRSVFQQAYTDKPLALQVQRIGPTIIIDTHGKQRRSVRDMREKALLGKALYRLEDAFLHPPPKQQGNGGGASEAGAGAEERPPTPTGAVALPASRIGAVTTASKVENRFSQTLRWDIDELEVLVGVDTPIVLDRRSNAEQVIKLEDVSEGRTASAMQRDALNCWFDATLANVPQVGIYMHKAGIIESFEVKKVQELLGLVEGRMATAAMTFTSNVLQWLVAECTKENGTYAAFRGYDSDYIALYELPGSKRTNPLADLMDVSGNGNGTAARKKAGAGRSAAAGGGGKATHHTQQQRQEKEEEGPEARAERRERQEEYNRMHASLARMCFRMGLHLVESGAVARAKDAAAHLLRSFAIFLQQPEAAGSVDCVVEIAAALPAVADRLIESGRAAQADGAAPPPEAFRAALVAIGRFETRLRLALDGPGLRPTTRCRYVRCLVPCSAALCVVVSRTLEAFYALRCECAGSPRPTCKGRQCAVAAAAPSDVDGSPCGPAKDLLQAAVEGLVRLEQLSNTVVHFAAVAQLHYASLGKQQQQQQQVYRAAGGKKRRKGKSAADRQTSGSGSCSGEGSVDGRAAEAPPVCSALMDPSTEIDCLALTASLAELFGDLTLLAMSDPSAFTVQVLREVSRRITGRATANSNNGNGGGNTDSPVSEAATATAVAAGRPVATTLRWLAALPTDLISLSFTALRLYARAGGAQDRRLLRKTASVYYLVGRCHARADRFTKALEALHRARSVFHAAAQAPEEALHTQCYCSLPLAGPPDVMAALGAVYARMAHVKARAATATTTAMTDLVPSRRPLSIGATHAVTAEELDFLWRSGECYSEGGWAVAAAAMRLRWASARIDAVTLAGVPAAAATSRQLHGAEAMTAALHGNDADSRAQLLRWEWEAMRLYTATAAGAASAALVKEALEAARSWAQRLSGSLIVVASPPPAEGSGGGGTTGARRTMPLPLSVLSSPPPPPQQLSAVPEDLAVPGERRGGPSRAEAYLQLALVHCTHAEASAAEGTGAADARRAAALVAPAMDEAAVSGEQESGLARWAVVTGARIVLRAVAATTTANSTGAEAARLTEAVESEVLPLAEADPAAAARRLRELCTMPPLK